MASALEHLASGEPDLSSFMHVSSGSWPAYAEPDRIAAHGSARMHGRYFGCGNWLQTAQKVGSCLLGAMASAYMPSEAQDIFLTSRSTAAPHESPRPVLASHSDS